MKHSIKTFCAGSIAVVVAAGCGGAGGALDSYAPANLGTAIGVAHFQGDSAAALGTIAAVGQNFTAGTAATCPAAQTSGNVTTLTGGCTSSGQTYSGTATITHDTGANAYETHFDHFGVSQPQQCTPTGGGAAVTVMQTQTFSGTVRSSDRHATHGTFHLDLTIESRTPDGACTLVPRTGAVVYDGTWDASGGDANGDGVPDHVVWNGRGRVGDSVDGVVSARTTDETIDHPACSHEPLSGTTQLQAGGHTALITYDGATDCVPSATATWTYDGAAMGTLTGVSCGVTRGRADSRAVLGLGLATLIAAAVRRRRG